MEYNVGDIVRTKKQHPCGSKLWELTRVGVDFKMKCIGCGHVVVLERQKALKAITKKESVSKIDFKPSLKEFLIYGLAIIICSGVSAVLETLLKSIITI